MPALGSLPRSTLRMVLRLSMVLLIPSLGAGVTWASPAPDDATLARLAESVDSSDVQGAEWEFMDLDPVVQKAVHRVVLDDDLEGALRSLSSTAGIGEGTARAVLWTALAIAREPFPEDCDATSVPRAVENAMRAVILAPEAPPPAVSTFGEFLRFRWECPTGRRLVHEITEREAADAAAAWADTNPELLDLAVHLEGPTPRLLLAQAESLWGLERAAAFERAYEELFRRGESLPPDLQRNRLEALFDAGAARRALDLWESGDAIGGDRDDGGEPEVSRDLDAVAAAILQGRPQRARELLPRTLPLVPGEPPNDAEWEERDRLEVARTSARLWQAFDLAMGGSGPGADDPFALLSDLALESPRGRSTLQLFLAKLSDDLGYPGFATYFRGGPLEWKVRSALEALDEPESEVVAALGDEILGLLEELAPYVDLTAGREPDSTPSATTRLPPGARVRPLRVEELVEDPPRAPSVSPPGGFGIVRCERAGDLVVALATSQALDPVGEVSPGAYWVLRSDDDGTTWEAWPTGIRVGAPYEAVDESLRPLASERGVAIEVRWARIDERSIVFPPIDLAVERREDPLVIEIPWKVLRADADGDGLSDLYEERLLTDPENADSDGDGISDFDDPLPDVAYVPDGNPVSEVLQALHSALGTEEQLAILPRCPGDRPGLCFGSSSPGLERVHFVVGDPSAWSGVVPSRRTVVLTPAQHREAEARWGPVYATRYSLLVVDPDGRRAVVIWDRSWQGGAARLTKTEAGWEVEVTSMWIT